MPTTDFDYNDVTCIPKRDGRIRYVLKKPGDNIGKNPLFVICLHSTTADEDEHDPTVRRAMTIAEEKFKQFKRFDGFVMFNLYPLRIFPLREGKLPTELPDTDEQKLLGKNIAAIKKELANANVTKPTIWAAWGGGIKKKPYLRECLREIVPDVEEATWLRFGDFTTDGHPRHPLYVKGDSKISEFKIKEYIAKLK